MNKIFRIIWNHAQQNWVVTSELASRQGKSNSLVDSSIQPTKSSKNFFLNLISLSVLMSLPLAANAYVAIGGTAEYSGIAQENAGTTSVSGVSKKQQAFASDDMGDKALDYLNPGSRSYNDPNQVSANRLYSGTLAGATGIAIGAMADARATGQSTYLPGESSGIAIGDYSKAIGALSFALGGYSIASDTGATAIGTASRASGFNSLAMMRQSAATNDYAMAIGNVSWAAGKGSLAMGQSSQAAGDRAIAIGSANVGDTESTGPRVTNYDANTNTQALADRSIAFGAKARTAQTATDAVALGSEANALSRADMAMGLGAVANGTTTTNNTAAMTNANVYAERASAAVAVGAGANATGRNAVAIGAGAEASTAGLPASLASQNRADNVAVGAAAQAAYNAVASGFKSKATGTGSVAIGSGAEAKAQNMIAIGINAGKGGATDESKKNTHGIAIGNGAGQNVISGTENVAIGRWAGMNVEGNTNYAIGVSAGNNVKGADNFAAIINAGQNVEGSQNIALGYYSGQYIKGSSNIAIGKNAGKYTEAEKLTSNNNIAIGTDTKANPGANGNAATAIGANANALANAATALGVSAQALGVASVAIGEAALASAGAPITEGSPITTGATTAVGRQSQATAGSASAFGSNANASGEGATALGNASSASGKYAVASGVQSNASGIQSTAIGRAAQATANDTIAIGSSAKGSAENAIALGINAQALASNAISIGNGNVVTGKNSGAIGDPTTITGAGTYSLGNDNGTIASSDSGVFGNNNNLDAAGDNNRVIGNYNTLQNKASGDMVMGARNTISGATDSEIIGNSNTVQGKQVGVFGDSNILTNNAGKSRILGNNNSINGQEAFVLGNNVKVQKDKAGTSARAIGIGSNATVNDNDSIAIGTSSHTDGNFVTAIGNKASASGDQALAVGSNTLATKSSTALGQEAQATGNVALAVGAGAKATGDNSMAVGQYSQAVGASSTAVGQGALTSANNAAALGYQAKAERTGALALGYNAQATLAGAVALGEGSNTVAAAVKTSSAKVNGITYSGFAGDKIGSARVVSVGTTEEGKQRQIKNVAAGQVTASSTDAINGSQLYMVANTVGNIANSVQTVLGGNAAIDPNTGNITMNNIGGTGKNTIDEAIKATKTHYYSVGANNPNDENYNNDGATGVDAIAAGVRARATGKGDIAVGESAFAESGSDIDDQAAVAVGYQAKATKIGAVAIGPVAQAKANNMVSMGYSAGSDSTAPNSVWIGVNAGNSASGISNIGIGDSAGSGIGDNSNYNVAMGVSAGGGINGSNNLALGTSTGSTLTGNDNVALGNTAGANLNGSNNIAIGRQAGTAVVVNDDPNELIFKSGASDTREVSDSISLGNNAQALKDKAVAIGLDSQAKNENDIALGAGAISETAVGTTEAVINGITYDGFAGTSPIATLSVGSASKERTITNVAAGRISKDSTDAINGSQLYAVAGNITDATKGGGFILTDDNNEKVAQDLGHSIQLKGEKGITVTANEPGKQLKIALGNEITIGDPENLSNPNAPKKAGTINVVGKDGKNGVSIKGDTGNDGKPGISIAGKDGADGITLTTKTDGKPDVFGGPTKPRLEVNNEEVATLNDGLKFQGNNDTTAAIQKKLNETLTIKGENAGDDVSATNMYVENSGSELIIKMAKALTDLTSATFTTPDGNTTVVNNNGVTITPKDGQKKPVSLTDAGLDNGGNQITNVASGGDVDTNAANIGDLKNATSNLVNKGFNIAADNGNEDNVKLGETVKFTDPNGNIVTTVADNEIKLALNKDLTVGDDKEPGTITVKGESGKDGVSLNGKDGSIGLNGKDGANGTITVKQGKPGVYGKDGEQKPRLDINGEDVATLNDGLKFAGDKGDTLIKKLNETVTIKGKAQADADVTDKNLRVDSENGELVIKMAKALTDLTSVATGDTLMDNNGVTINNGKAGKPVSLTKDGLDNGGNKITNVAAGTAPTDAVNVSQLEKAQKAATTKVVEGKNIKVTETKNTDGSKTYTVATANDLDVNSVKAGDTVLNKQGVKAGDTVLNKDGVKVGDKVALTKDGLKVGDVNISTDGINAGNKKVTGVANGDISATSQDAVNGSQLYTVQQAAKAAKTEVEAGDNIEVTSKTGGNGQTVYTVATKKEVNFDKVNVGGVSINKDTGINAGNNKVTGVSAGNINANSTDAVNGSQLHETNQNVAENAANIANNTATINKGLNFTADDGQTLNRKLGDTVAVNGDENIKTSVTSSGVKVALNKNLKVDSITAGNTVVNNEGVTIGSGNNAVSLTQNGLNNGGNRITNVAPGTAPTDAVNVAQLSNVANHLDNKVNKVAGDMKRMDKKLRAGIAGAAALGMLPQPTRPGKSMVSVGGTTYRNESAVALGVSRVSDNEKWVIKVGASANTRNNYIVGGSVGYQW
ncbi:YadA-like family protein [Avibacterium sp. 20-15]|uniref:YadA-like family protein n=1 Tax=unclassified Avibacterium TaxID=2685287 RepID=UPI002025EC7E|nr:MULTISPECIES: YadA-like family protein [unclassified Avibacterium]MCW9733305.1 YadA-like family protein [Avibacterium sp. 20-15]URL05417.1 YadA-like family protein [Avibacterium sp. 20-132]